MIVFDLNVPRFQDSLLELDRDELLIFFASLRKLRRLSWEQLYSDKGFRWELIKTATGPGGSKLYSIRITKQFRAVVQRNADHLVFLSLHPDHDSAYRK